MSGLSKNWIELSEVETNQIWDDFYKRFQFKPSTKREDWPSIISPIPSKTWSIEGFDDLDSIASEEKQDELCILISNAFKKISPTGWIYALDWQHACYKINLNQEFLNNKSSDWKIPLVPDGDYSIFLTSDLDNGVFSHPWEKTFCVFGNELLNLTDKFLDEKLFTPM